MDYDNLLVGYRIDVIIAPTRNKGYIVFIQTNTVISFNDLCLSVIGGNGII